MTEQQEAKFTVMITGFEERLKERLIQMGAAQSVNSTEMIIEQRKLHEKLDIILDRLQKPWWKRLFTREEELYVPGVSEEATVDRVARFKTRVG